MANILRAATYSARMNCLSLLRKRVIRIVAKNSYYAHTWSRCQYYNIMKFDKVNYYQVRNFIDKYLHNL